MEAPLLDLLQSSVTVATVAGRDSYNKKSYNTGVSHAARIRFGNVGVYGPYGTEVTSSAQVWMDGDVNVKTEDQITLPDSTTPEILRVDRPQDENGDIDHTKLFLR